MIPCNNKNVSYILFTYFIDNNECILATHNCHNNATCLNSNGSFTCLCNTGYSGNGVSCGGEGKLSWTFNIRILNIRRNHDINFQAIKNYLCS